MRLINGQKNFKTDYKGMGTPVDLRKYVKKTVN